MKRYFNSDNYSQNTDIVSAPCHFVSLYYNRTIQRQNCRSLKRNPGALPAGLKIGVF